MLRSASAIALLSLVASPAIAGNCAYGHTNAAAASAPLVTTYVQPAVSQPTYSQPVYSEPASVTSYTTYSEVQPTITYVSAQPDIVDRAVSAGSFNTLVAAVQAAGLVDTLKGPGPFTVFAPTDDAFAALPVGTVEDLLKPENRSKLTDILTYHVVPGKVLSGDLAGKMLAASTVQGQSVKIDGTAGVRVGNANVVSADIETSNGVIHVIDTVLIPGA